MEVGNSLQADFEDGAGVESHMCLASPLLNAGQTKTL